MTTATISPLKAYSATYRPTATARRSKRIGAFFARSYDEAADYAFRVVDHDTFGQGIVMSVEETADPRK